MSIPATTALLSKIGCIPRPLIALAIFVSLVVSAPFILSAVMSKNNRISIAQALLYDPPMKLSKYEKRIDPIFSGALSGKFPSGSDAEKLFVFVSALGGWCVKYPEGKAANFTHTCSIVIESELFSSTDLGIEAKVEQGKVVELRASQKYETY